MIEPSDSNNSKADKSKLKSAIVGTGYIADFHARAIEATPGVALVCAADANLRNAQSFAGRWGLPSAYDSLESMLQSQQIDCVHLLVPPDHHFRLAKI